MATKNRRPGRPTQAEAERLDEQLREAAVATFLEYGYDGASMEAIARAAGVTKQTLYFRYPDKRAVFVDVIPWALSRRSASLETTDADGEDLEGSLTAIAREALERSTDPQILRLQRIAMNQSGRFPEFEISAETMRWSPRLRAVMDVLQLHSEAGEIVIDPDEIELAAEHFLALVEALPARLADFGVFRTAKERERHMRYAIKLFLQAVRPTPQKSAAGRLTVKRSRRHGAEMTKRSTNTSTTKRNSRAAG